MGDVLTSVIEAASEAKINMFDYLTALIENEKNVKEQPEQWLPWNYRQKFS